MQTSLIKNIPLVLEQGLFSGTAFMTNIALVRYTRVSHFSITSFVRFLSGIGYTATASSHQQVRKRFFLQVSCVVYYVFSHIHI